MSTTLAGYHPRMFLLSIVPLVIANIVENVYEMYPCQLCVYERYGYWFLITVAITGLGTMEGINDAGHKFLMKVSVIIILVAIGITLYHIGIERGIFEPTASCHTDIDWTAEISDNKFRQMLYKKPFANCSTPAVLWFGISMTEYNLLYNIFLLIFTIRTHQVNPIVHM